MVIFHCYVSLPEGMSGYGLNLSQPDMMPAVFVKLNFLGYQLYGPINKH